jgi:hypothetical protein
MNITKQRAALAIGACGLLAAAGCAGTTTIKKVAVPGPTVTKTVPVPGETKDVPVPGPTKIVTKTTIKTVPTPAPTEGTLLNFTGTGNAETPSFTVGGDGDYTVSWTFSGNDQQGDGGDNFIVDENTVGNGQDANATDLPNVIQTSGNGNTGISDDAGVHTFNVQADQGSTWTIKVVSAP